VRVQPSRFARATFIALASRPGGVVATAWMPRSFSASILAKHILFSPATPDAPAAGYFNADRRLTSIATSDLTAYVAHRLGQGAARASINHELAILRRAFRLAMRAGEIAAMSYVPMLRVSNTRVGFFEREQFEAVLGHLSAELQAPLKFAYGTGWRFGSEVLPLTVTQVDLQAGIVRLEPGTTKSGEGRTFSVTAESRALLQQQLDSIDALKQRGVICPYVFHRPDGSRIKDFRKRWRKACEDAGYPGKLLHDFRRTAVRNLERAGVPRSTAMAMVGHKTESIYRRYAIIDEAMHREAAARLDMWADEQRVKAEAKGKLKQFAVQALKNS
jgi:integrase